MVLVFQKIQKELEYEMLKCQFLHESFTKISSFLEISEFLQRWNGKALKELLCVSSIYRLQSQMKSVVVCQPLLSRLQLIITLIFLFYDARLEE